MAMTITVLDTTEHSLTLLLTEAGTTAAENARDIIDDCEDGALKTLLQTAVADAAAAEALIEDNCTVTVRQRAGSTGDPTGMAISFDDAATVIEMNCLAVKINDADTAVWVVKIQLEHSLVK